MKKTVSLILIIIWMAVIFAFSSQPGTESSGTSGKATQIILDIISIVVDFTEEQKEDILEWLNPIVRKIAHFTIYLIGGLLIMNYINMYNINEKNKIAYSIVIGMLYATSDEIHQLFVEGRSGLATDVLIDTLGVATGVIIFYIVKKLLIRYFHYDKINV